MRFCGRMRLIMLYNRTIARRRATTREDGRVPVTHWHACDPLWWPVVALMTRPYHSEHHPWTRPWLPHHPVGPRWRTQGMLKAAKQDHTEQLQLTSNDH